MIAKREKKNLWQTILVNILKNALKGDYYMSVNKLMKTSTTGGIGNAAYMRVNSE